MCLGVQYVLESLAFLLMLLSELIWCTFVVDLQFQLLRLVQVVVSCSVGQSVLFDCKHVEEFFRRSKENITVHWKTLENLARGHNLST